MGGKNCVDKIEQVPCVSLESLNMEKSTWAKSSSHKKYSSKLNGYVIHDLGKCPKQDIVQVIKVESISMEKSETVVGDVHRKIMSSRKGTKERIVKVNHIDTHPSYTQSVVKSVFATKNTNGYGNTSDGRSTKKTEGDEENAKENRDGLVGNKVLVNGTSTTFPNYSDGKCQSLVSNGHVKQSSIVKANGYITINQKEVNELQYKSANHNLTHSNKLNGNLPNGIYQRMEDSPYKKYGGRVSEI